MNGSVDALAEFAEALAGGRPAPGLPEGTTPGEQRLARALETLSRELHAARRSTHQNELRYRLVTESAHEAIYDWDLVANRLEWSEGMQSVFGFDERSIGGGIEWWHDCVHPDDRAHVVAGLEHAMAERAPSWTAEYRFRRGDGAWADVLDRGAFVYDEVGDAVRMIGSMLDVTEARRAEAERQRLAAQVAAERARLADLVANVPGIVWEVHGSPHGPLRVDFVSDHLRHVLGYEPSEWVRHPWLWLGLVHEEDRERVRHEMASVHERGRAIVRYRVHAHDGHLAWLESHCTAVSDATGSPTGLRGVTLDVTDRVLAEREREALLSQLQRALDEAKSAIATRDEFLVIASHELKTPLTSLHLQMQALSRLQRSGQLATLPEERVRSILAIGEQQVRRLNTLVGELLDVSRLASGRRELQRERFSLAALAAEVLERFRPELESSGTDVRVHAEDAAIGRWDRGGLDQVLTNLVSNALKYGEGRPIDVEVSSGDGLVTLVVRDRGIGIAPEDQARIFDRFERAVSLRHFGGFGLGLYITREIVELHGGTIEVQSRRGAGSTFTVRLPKDSTAAAPTGA